MISSANHDHITYALPGVPKNKINNSTIFYGCQQYTGTTHCDRLHNKFESYTIKSQSTTLYNVTDTPTFVPGKDKLGLQMYANLLKSVTFSNTSSISPKQFSIAFWIKGVSLPDDPVAQGVGYIISQFTHYHPAGWSFVSTLPYGQNLSKQSVRFTVYNNEDKAFFSPDVPIFNKNNFTHIVGTFDGSSIKIYKDGVFFGEAKFNGTYNKSIRVPLTLGVASRYPMLFYWTGNIDDLRYYNKALSTSEIKQIFTDPNSIVAPTSLIGNWKFDRNLDDASGNNHTGTQRTLVSSMAFAPDGRLFFSEKDTGNIRIMENGKVKPKPFATIGDYHSNWEQGLLGLALDPDFKENHFVYQFYTTIDKDTKKAFNRIVRFTDLENQGTNQTIILDRIPASSGYHSGGAMAFGPDDKLYITIGDATEDTRCGNLPNSTGATCPSQDPSSLLGKVLRINRDGSIPIDNPYPNSPVYNIGHLNMYGIAFDKSGFGLLTENGGSLYDEINTVERGENYGYPTLETLNVDPELTSNYTKPLRSYYIANCLTQMIYYEGNKIPHLKDKFLFGTLTGTAPLYALKVDRDRKQVIGEEVISLNTFPNNQVVALAQSPDGDIYYGTYAINKLDSVTNNSKSQLLFPIGINYSSSQIHIGDLSSFPSKKEMVLDIDVKTSSDSNIVNMSNIGNTNFPNALPNSYLSLSVPKALLEEIALVNVTTNFTVGTQSTNYTSSIDQNPSILDYKIQNLPKSDHTILNFLLKQAGHYKLIIFGKNI